MAEAENLNESENNDTFINVDDDTITELLNESKAKNTNRSTNTALTRFKTFLKFKKLPDLDLLPEEDLPNILGQYYTSVRTKKTGEMYQTSSFKVLCSGLNRYFKRERNIDIVSDDRFIQANLIFDSVQVKAKKIGKGVTKSSPHISPEDLKILASYFDVNHVQKPNPRILQQCVQFYIMYFFCRHGQENLYEMTIQHFKTTVDYDGTRYVEQTIDEKDKNHGINDTKLANQGKMYEDRGLCNFNSF